MPALPWASVLKRGALFRGAQRGNDGIETGRRNPILTKSKDKRPGCDNHRHLVSKHDVGPNLWRGMWLGLALGTACRERAQEPAEWPITTRTPPACHIDAPSACRVGCDADQPRKLFDAAPDLGALEVADLHGVAIVEILIDERGDVKDACLLRGVREDVDSRVMAAIRQWRFEPVRLRHSTPPGVVVPAVITVGVRVGG